MLDSLVRVSRRVGRVSKAVAPLTGYEPVREQPETGIGRNLCAVPSQCFDTVERRSGHPGSVHSNSEQAHCPGTGSTRGHDRNIPTGRDVLLGEKCSPPHQTVTVEPSEYGANSAAREPAADRTI